MQHVAEAARGPLQSNFAGFAVNTDERYSGAGTQVGEPAAVELNMTGSPAVEDLAGGASKRGDEGRGICEILQGEELAIDELQGTK